MVAIRILLHEMLRSQYHWLFSMVYLWLCFNVLWAVRGMGVQQVQSDDF